MLFKRDKKVYSPINGEHVDLKDVNDITFSSELMGPGLGIYPESQIIVSPINGELTMLFSTKHALGLKRSDGLEILIHVGIETVNLNGEGFKTLIKQNEKIKVGTPLLHFDPQYILEKGFDPTVIIIFTNGTEFVIDNTRMKGNVTIGDVICDVNRKK